MTMQPGWHPFAASQANAQFTQFAPKPDRKSTKLDYSIWDEALHYFVLRMGRSLREGALRPDPSIGTRIVYGHDSRYRLEGNRVVFSILKPEVVASLTEYRQDLESIADRVDISRLDRNEQLAFWLNLHNVAVVEQIALAYPVSDPSQVRIGKDRVPLDDAKFITINGVAMSPRDIREKIVFPHWRDPRVIYGFFRGDIGVPSIRRDAFTAANVDDQLEDAANEFVNSLRGVQQSGHTMRVSVIHGEAAPWYFQDFSSDLRNHIAGLAETPVKRVLANTDDVQATIRVNDLADLSKGEVEPAYGNVAQVLGPHWDQDDLQQPREGINLAALRLLDERASKFEKARRRGFMLGDVIVVGYQRDEAELPVEVR